MSSQSIWNLTTLDSSYGQKLQVNYTATKNSIVIWAITAARFRCDQRPVYNVKTNNVKGVDCAKRLRKLVNFVLGCLLRRNLTYEANLVLVIHYSLTLFPLVPLLLLKKLKKNKGQVMKKDGKKEFKTHCIAILQRNGLGTRYQTYFTFFLSLLVCRLNSLISFGASPPEVAPRDFVTSFGCETDFEFLTRTVMPSFCAYKSKIGRHSDDKF